MVAKRIETERIGGEEIGQRSQDQIAVKQNIDVQCTGSVGQRTRPMTEFLEPLNRGKQRPWREGSLIERGDPVGPQLIDGELEMGGAIT